MKGLLTNQDWFRMILMTCFAAYLVHQIYMKTDLLLMKETGFTEVAMDSENMIFPSITFCPASMTSHELHVPTNNITADWQNLPRLEDMLVQIKQKIRINKYDETLLGIRSIYNSAI